MENKHLYIISGCNGAGKTTASYTRKQIASGGRNADTIIDEEALYLKMQSYVK